MCIKIKSVAHYLPKKIMLNDEWQNYFETSDEWIFSHTGIRQRHVADETETTASLAINAGKKALEKANFKASDIDFIIVATSTPDYSAFPSTACLVQKGLGANCPAYDISAACTGFVFAMATAKAFLDSNPSFKNILIIGSEVFTRIINWYDRNSAILFGDGAGAMILSSVDDNDSNKKDAIIDYKLYSEGETDPLYQVGCGSASILYNKEDNTKEKNTDYVIMDGGKVYQFAVKCVGDMINEILEKHKLSIDDIDYIVPHQANERIITAVCKRYKWSKDKFFLNVANVANTSAASIPIALSDMVEGGLLKEGMRIIILGFGGGLTWGSAFVEW